MRYIGVTGNIASGKSEVARRLAEHGATIIDADLLARDVVAPGMPAFQRIVARWGAGVVAPDGTLDRSALRQIVFKDRAELAMLDGIVHPEVAVRRDALLAEARWRGDAVVVYVVPLLFEKDMASGFDTIVLVDAPEELRLRRIVEGRSLSTEEAQAMIAAQMPAERKRGGADIVIENGGSLDELRRRVDAVWEQLTGQDGRPSLAV